MFSPEFESKILNQVYAELERLKSDLDLRLFRIERRLEEMEYRLDRFEERLKEIEAAVYEGSTVDGVDQP